MLTWKIIFLWMLPCYRAEDDGIFECGAHGRFEYCIDGIPGCVIGCHCHPGYYFDTDTKICEPNTKLTLNYRRHYMPEPTRVQNPIFLSNVAQTELSPTLTTRNVIDEHVNDIAKNADDLGDWLYNQFFKTIENQVINNTDKDSQLTRRNGRGSVPKHNKLKRRARRKGDKHRKKKKGLRGKLLRIAEDDSLFQSSDSSGSDSGNTDVSRSDSSTGSDSDEDHGHKKILLINKKPKPPLPSFIFLPNMNTPYYPPIGLPAPPVMYPMAPIPPMMGAPPLMPFPGGILQCEESTTAVSTVTTSTSVITSTEEISMKTDSDIITITAQFDELSPEVPVGRSRYKGRKRNNKVKSFGNIPDEEEDFPSDIYEPTRGSRQKLMKLLRQRLKYPKTEDSSFKIHKKPFDSYINQLIPPDTLMDNDITDDFFPKNANSPPAKLESTPELENVDFKYLSQLIHRVNENQTQDVPVHNYNVQDSPKTIGKWSDKKYRDFSIPLDSGRRINQYTNTSRNHQADDSYYSNLGRQIASLIRTIDADKERQFNIEIENVHKKTNDHPYFNENGPRTFWERSVRSPLRFFNSFKNKFNNLKSSNELLFNIENKVETVASTVSPLNLQELENLINVMETARTQFQSDNKIKTFKPFTKTLNVNLWPQDIKESKKSIKSSIAPNIFSVQRRKALNYSNSTQPEIINTKLNNISEHNLYPLKRQVKMHKANEVLIERRSQMQPASRNITRMYTQPKDTLKDQIHLHSSERRRFAMKPTILNYKNIKKYFFDNGNQYSFQNDDIRMHISPASRVSKQQINHLVPSPYFHHEINHIDYIS